MKAIMVMYDSLNRHMLPNHGCDWTLAPNFARLAERTVTFDNHYVGSMPCMLMIDLELSVLDGLILVGGLALVLYRLLQKQQVVARDLQDGVLFQTEDLPDPETRQATIAFGTGLAAILMRSPIRSTSI